jgi:hypothetical protein
MHAKKILASILMIGFMSACLVLAQVPVSSPPAQPLPFSHKQHLTLDLQCKNCHEMPEPGDAATLPSTSKCMGCHSRIKKDNADIRHLAEYNNKRETIPWKRVYRIPDYVSFNHKTHIVVGKVLCEECHGAVREMDVIQKVKETSMLACMDCHRKMGASIACNLCHDPQE